jgi:arginine N-succinyltransferase
MFIIRPIRLTDLDAYTNFAFMANVGITSMPKNRELLKKNIEESLASFAPAINSPKNENYLFALEKMNNGDIGGVSAIYSKSGVEEPKYYYHIDTLHKEGLGLPVPKNIKILKAVNIHNGPSEIGSLYLDPYFRKEGLGRLLSLSRLLFAACFPERFDDVIVADMRGYIDKSNTAPFWEGFGRHFLDLEFPALMQLLEKGKSFIPRIIPDYPAYISLLPKKIQEAIGKVHDNTKPALNMLVQEGFIRSDYIDIFDAGPMITARREEIRCVKESHLAKVREITSEDIPSEKYIICNNRIDFKACFGHLEVSSDFGARLAVSVAEVLDLKIGDIFRYVSASPKKLSEGIS